MSFPDIEETEAFSPITSNENVVFLIRFSIEIFAFRIYSGKLIRFVCNLACNFCSSSDHDTYICPVLSKGEHVSYLILFIGFSKDTVNHPYNPTLS